MSQQIPTHSYSQPAAAPAPSNGLGTTGFILGLIGLVLSPIPFIGVIAWPLVILGLIFSAIGFSKVSKGKATNKGLAIAGMVTSIIGLAICIVWAFVIDSAVDEVNETLDEVANEQVIVSYEVTGDAPGVEIDYSTYGDTVVSHNETIDTLPWSKEVETKGLMSGGSLIVTTGEQGGSVSCKVQIDGQEVQTATASGPFAIADCSGF
ncbi:DUF4190 domain-containing protein [Actinophytocola sediminis]